MMTMSYPAVSSELPPPSSRLVWAVELTPLLTPHSPESAGPMPRRFPRTPLHLFSSTGHQKKKKKEKKHNRMLSTFCVSYLLMISSMKPEVRETVVFLPM